MTPEVPSPAILLQTIERSPIGHALVSLDGTFLTANPALCAITGFSRDELVGMASQEITHHDDVQADVTHTEALAARDIDSYTLDKRFLRKDGAPIWVRVFGSAVFSAEGELEAFVVQIKDISEQRLLAQRLEQSEARYRMIAENAADVILLVRNGTFDYVSPSVTQLLGWSPDELIGQSTIRFAHPDDRDAVLSVRDRLAAGQEAQVRLRLRRSDDSWAWVQSHAQAVHDVHGDVIGSLSVVRDISVELQAERSRQRELERSQFREAVSETAARAGLDVERLLNNVADLNLQLLADLISIAVVDETEQTLRQVVLRHLDESLKEELSRLRKATAARGEGLAGQVWASGEPLVLLDVDSEAFPERIVPAARPFFAAFRVQSMLILPLRVGDQILGTITVARSRPSENFDNDDLVLMRQVADICAMALSNAQLHADLQRSEGNYRLLATNAADVVLLLEDFRIVWASPSVQRYGWQPSEMLGRPTLDFAHPADAPAIQTARSSRPDDGVLKIRFRFRRADGEYTWVESHTRIPEGSRSVKEDPSGVVVSLRDIDDQVQADAALQQSHQQLEQLLEELNRANKDLEQFAYVTSHDLRAPLRTISGYCHILTSELKSHEMSEASEEALQQIANGVAEMQSLITALLEYSRLGGESRPKVRTVAETIDIALRHVQADLDDDPAAQVVLAIPDDLTWSVDDAFITSGLVNIVQNSIKYRSPDRPLKIQISAVADEGTITLTLTDNGIGIPPDRIMSATNMFERLTTTHQGLGIGLASALRIIQHNKGILDLDSDGATYTTVRIRVPQTGLDSQTSQEP
ncbi:MAG: PAS domain S-box protein [Actinobacteria bacterium]|nr:PAS domain S-box protein [Actinomycetota bacterium]